MQTEGVKCSYDASYIEEKYPCYRYAIHFIENEDIVQRKVGYSLLAPLFKILPNEVQEYIRYIWQIEQEKGRMPFTFVKCCEAIFMEERYEKGKIEN